MNKRKGATAVSQKAAAPTYTPIVGHAAQRAFFKDLLRTDRFPSTLLLAGPGGIGKRRVGLEIAQSLFCEANVWGGCGKCKSCALFAAKNVADLYQIDFASADAGSVEDVRALLYSLQLKNFSGKNRVIIFDNAHLMSTPVTNILLKSLEEPRPSTYFILISSSKARMLPTLLSRCQTTHFEALSEAEMREVIKASGASTLSAADQDFAVRLSDGSFDNHKSIVEELARAKEIAERLDKIIDGDIPEATRLSGELAKEKERIGDHLRLLTVMMRDKLRSETSRPALRRIATGLQNCVAAERFVLDRNLSAGYLLSLIFTQLLPALPEQRDAEPLLIEHVIV